MIQAIKELITGTPAETNAAAPVPKPAADLRGALTAARDALGHALRTLIANDIHDGTSERNRLENAFENAKNALGGEAKVAHLENAAKDLALAVNILSNHSLKNGDDLKTVKEAHAAAESAANRLKAPVN